MQTYLFSILFVGILFYVTTNKHISNAVVIIDSQDHFIKYKNMPKYIINLDKRVDRLRLTQKLLSLYGFNTTRFPAISGKQLSEIELTQLVHPKSMTSIKNGYRTSDADLSIGAVGCSLSHILLWQKLLNSNNNGFMIFEDDTLPNFTLEHFKKYIDYIPDDWDIILLGYVSVFKKENINSYISKIYSWWGTHAYIIHKNKINTLLNEAFPLKTQIDHWLGVLAQEGKINVYGLKYTKWDQNYQVNSTDIQIDIIKQPITKLQNK
jgi:GR25 family glycosyltransferase involved in LPS biosynthesis